MLIFAQKKKRKEETFLPQAPREFVKLKIKKERKNEKFVNSSRMKSAHNDCVTSKGGRFFNGGNLAYRYTYQRTVKQKRMKFELCARMLTQCSAAWKFGDLSSWDQITLRDFERGMRFAIYRFIQFYKSIRDPTPKHQNRL